MRKMTLLSLVAAASLTGCIGGLQLKPDQAPNDAPAGHHYVRCERPTGYRLLPGKRFEGGFERSYEFKWCLKRD